MGTLENKYLLVAKSFVRSHMTFLMPLGLRVTSRFMTMPDERAYFLKQKRLSESKEPSLILLSQPRAGTQVCEKVLATLYEKTGGVSLKTGRFYFHYDASSGRKVSSAAWVKKQIEKSGYFYGSMGPFPSLDELPDVKYLLMTRDPRDVIISHYYSVKEAHVINSKKMEKEVLRVKGMSLVEYCFDEYILNDLEKYLDQANMILSSDLDYMYVKYEELIDKPSEQLSKISSFIGLTSDKAEFSRLVEENFGAPPEPDNEDLLRHRRSGAWGQFREKLPAEVQDMLWSRFGDKMVKVGYGKNSVDSI